MNKKQNFLKGMRAGVPIALGYFAVAIAIGIEARNSGLSVFAAALSSLLLNASAGEYAGFALIAAGASYVEVAIMEAVANARYLLMSASLSQKLDTNIRPHERLLLGFCITDEIFGASISLEGRLSPYFTYGAFVVATTGWTSGTVLGALLGNILPTRIMTALAVGLFGMFISVFIPEAKKNRVVAALVVLSFAASFAFEVLPVVSKISSGIRTIILTVLISLAAAIFFPIKEERDSAA